MFKINLGARNHSTDSTLHSLNEWTFWMFGVREKNRPIPFPNSFPRLGLADGVLQSRFVVGEFVVPKRLIIQVRLTHVVDA